MDRDPDDDDNDVWEFSVSIAPMDMIGLGVLAALICILLVLR